MGGERLVRPCTVSGERRQEPTEPSVCRRRRSVGGGGGERRGRQPRSQPPHYPTYRFTLEPICISVGALILLRRDTRTGELTQIESHTGAEEERASCHVDELTRFGAARRLAHVPGGSEGEEGGCTCRPRARYPRGGGGGLTS